MTSKRADWLNRIIRPAKQFGQRLAIQLTGVLLSAGLPAAATRAATVGNCEAVRGYPQASTGAIRWAGMSECFAMFFEHGYTYTVIVDAGPSYYRYSSNIHHPLGDSVLELYRSKYPGIGVSDPYNAAGFERVGQNDDYALPAHLGSRVTYKVTGNPYMSTLFVARVTGFGNVVGTYSISVTRSIEADLDDCQHIFACW